MLHVFRNMCNITRNTCNIKRNTCNITRNTCNITRVRVHIRVRVRVRRIDKATKFHQNRTRYGDLTIFKMAAVRHLGFWKFAVFVTWPLSACRSAWSYKISLKSNNWLLSYGQKNYFQYLEFLVFQFLVACLSSGSIPAVVYQISSKSDDFSLRYGDLAIFKMAAVRHLGFVMTSQYCIAVHIFIVQILSWNFLLFDCVL